MASRLQIDLVDGRAPRKLRGPIAAAKCPRDALVGLRILTAPDPQSLSVILAEASELGLVPLVVSYVRGDQHIHIALTLDGLRARALTQLRGRIAAGVRLLSIEVVAGEPDIGGSGGVRAKL